MSNSGLKSFSYSAVFTVNTATTTYSNFNLLAGNGLTSISPVGKNVRIKKVSSFARCLERSNSITNLGGQLNSYQIEFFYVDFGGQLIKVGFGFNNLFVPNPNILISSIESFHDSVNNIIPEKNVELLGAGIYIDRISCAIQNVIVGNINIEFDITVWYDDLECN